MTIVCTGAEVGDSGEINGITYTKRTRDQITHENAATTCTSGITDMSELFMVDLFDEDDENRASFNYDISNWDVSSVTDMSAMFAIGFGESSFNADIATWDVSSVTSMREMFQGANSFNANLSRWDVSSVTDMSQMFFGAENFNQDLSRWCVKNIPEKPEQFINLFYPEDKLPKWGSCSWIDD